MKLSTPDSNCGQSMSSSRTRFRADSESGSAKTLKLVALCGISISRTYRSEASHIFESDLQLAHPVTILLLASSHSSWWHRPGSQLMSSTVNKLCASVSLKTSQKSQCWLLCSLEQERGLLTYRAFSRTRCKASTFLQ